MNRLWSDLRYGARMLRKTPTAVLAVLIALSLGIGLSALTFSVIQGAVLTTLQSDDGRIVRLWRGGDAGTDGDDYQQWRERGRSFAEMGAASMGRSTLALDGVSGEPVSSAAITPSILPTVGVAPAQGRGFVASDAQPGAPAVALISHRIWERRLLSDPGILGRVIRLDGVPTEVIGVMPEGFGFPWDQDVWTPLATESFTAAQVGESAESRTVVARLRPGVSLGDASAELTAITRELDRSAGREVGEESIAWVTDYTDLFSERGASAILAALMLGVALLVLLVACANVANVLLARAIDRRREVAIRLAIGASRGRITGQILTEVALLALAGAAGGIAIASFGVRFITAAIPPGMPYWVAFRVDLRVIAFVGVVAVVTALMAGLMPALRASNANTHDVLKDGSRGSSGMQAGRIMRRLIGVEMALSFVLLVLAGLFIKSAVTFRATDFPFAPDGVFSGYVALPTASYPADTDRVRMAEEIQTTLGDQPELRAVALGTAVPGVGSSMVVPVAMGREGMVEGDGVRTRLIVVSPGYFDLFGAPPVAGRDFDGRDQLNRPGTAVVNQPFADRYFPAGAVGEQIRRTDDDSSPLTIVGVVPDLLAGGVEGENPEAVYLPFAQNPQASVQILARTTGSYESAANAIRSSLASIDPDIPLSRALPLSTVIDQANSQYTWFSLLFMISGGIALFLAAIGLYGVMAFWVIQRTREIGVRMALGGQRADIVRLVLRQGMSQTVIGLAAGILLAIPAAILVRQALYGVAPWDPVVFGAILTVLAISAGLGSWIPARRATRMDPLHALAVE